MHVSLTQSRTWLRRYRVTCSVSLTEVEHATIVTQGMGKREVLNWWTWDGEQKAPDPIVGSDLMRPFSRTFKTQGEANHFQEQLQTGLRQFKEYLTYSSKPVPQRSFKL